MRSLGYQFWNAGMICTYVQMELEVFNRKYLAESFLHAGLHNVGSAYRIETFPLLHFYGVTTHWQNVTPSPAVMLQNIDYH